MPTNIRLTLIGATALFLSGNAHALLLGTNVDGFIQGEILGGPCMDSGERTVGAGVEYGCDFGSLRWEADIGDTSLDVIVTNVLSKGVNIGNDVTVHLEFSGVTITNVSGPAGLTFSGNTIDVYIPLATPDVDRFHWDIVAEAIQVPEPGSLALLACGLLGIRLVRRRQIG